MSCCDLNMQGTQSPVDCPSLNPSAIMLLLELQCWVEGNKLLYKHFRKPMAKPLLTEMLAMPVKLRRTALTQI